MTKNTVDNFLIIIVLMLIHSAFFMLGHGVGKSNKEELEQELCQLKQYEYCTKEELLKTIK